MIFKTDVERKLFKIKEIIRKCRQNVKIISRHENLKTMRELIYTEEDIIEEIKSLTAKNYSDGPETDRDGSKGEVWFFGKKIKEKMYYIKLKIIKLKNGDELVILSFHPAVYEMKFPFA